MKVPTLSKPFPPGLMGEIKPKGSSARRSPRSRLKSADGTRNELFLHLRPKLKKLPRFKLRAKPLKLRHTARFEQIKRAVQEGTYAIPPSKLLAAKLLEELLLC